MLKEGTMSINPLELLAAARLILEIAENGMIPPWTRTVVIRIDNTIECICVNSGRALSRIMRRALQVFVDVQQSSRMQVIDQHIRTERNTVADLLSRGKGR